MKETIIPAPALATFALLVEVDLRTAVRLDFDASADAARLRRECLDCNAQAIGTGKYYVVEEVVLYTVRASGTDTRLKIGGKLAAYVSYDRAVQDAEIARDLGREVTVEILSATDAAKYAGMEIVK